jgi:serine/threonine-protein kinase
LTRIRDGLADRYTVERELGRGGMATVYLATDRRHQRSVAIKVLGHDLASTLGAERFLREIQTAARLQHPNILALHDSGEVDGSLFYVMPYVEGESLRNRLDREKRLPLDEAVRITREIAAGLAYAHARHVVHRDIKPENILFPGGTAGEAPHALIADFGIARAPAEGSDTLTQAGISLGTPSYMSPEQASGEPRIDGRSDTYSLACVLYEMLGGHPPFLGTTTQEILARHLRDPVPPLRTIRPDVPESVERAVSRALAKIPEARYATSVEFAAALTSVPVSAKRSRGWAIAAVALALIAMGYGVTVLMDRPDHRGTAAADDVPSIAVLPFTNVNGDSANAPFSDGVADELTTALGRVGGLNVVARASAFSFRRSGLDAREIGRRLGVRYVVEGRVRSADQRRRVGAELIDIETGTEIWSDTFDGDVGSGDVFSIQDSITRSIVRQVLPRIAAQALPSPARRPTESGVAHDLYLQGRYFFERRDSVSQSRAQTYFRQAIASDSSFALAYAGLSDAYSHQSVFGLASPGVNFPKARENAERALELDSSLVEVHTSLGFIALFHDWDYAAAGRAFAKAIAVNPRYAPAHLFRAWYLIAADSAAESLAEGRLALSLDPFSSVISTRLVTFLYLNRRFDEAVEQAKRTLERDSLFVGVRAELARALASTGRCAEALTELTVPGVDQPPAQLSGIRGLVYAKCGRRAAATALLDSIRGRLRAGRRFSHYGLAVIEAALGNVNEAIAELDLARDERAWAMFVIKHEPAFDPLRTDPRFHRLLRELNLAPAQTR